MLDRVDSNDKVKYQLFLRKETIRDIKKRAADAYKTQSKYITDLVAVDLVNAEDEPEHLSPKDGD